MEFTLSKKTVSAMLIFILLEVFLSYICSNISIFQSEIISISYIMIILCSYLLSPLYGLVVALISLPLHFALGIAVFSHPLSLIFDYLLPMIAIGLVGFIPLFKKQYPLGILLVYMVNLVFHLISGYFAFKSSLVDSITYYVPCDTVCCIGCFLLFILLYPRLKKIIHL